MGTHPEIISLKRRQHQIDATVKALMLESDRNLIRLHHLHGYDHSWKIPVKASFILKMRKKTMSLREIYDVMILMDESYSINQVSNALQKHAAVKNPRLVKCGKKWALKEWVINNELITIFK